MSSPSTVPDGKKDFARLDASGEAAGLGRSVGLTVGRWRNGVAGALVRLGVTPNVLTVVGFFFSIVGSFFLMLSAGAALPIDGFAPADVPRSWLPLLAVFWYLVSMACDMLDGAVARVGNMRSDFGAVLDSTLDRVSDSAVWIACGVYFAALGNVTYCVLAFFALVNAYMISYIKARAEDIIPDCTVGFWQRPERSVAILLGIITGHVQILLWQQALLPLFTVWRRLRYTHGCLRAMSRGDRMPEAGVPAGWRGHLMLWRHPRGSIGYDVPVVLNILVLVCGPWLITWFYRNVDPLGALLRAWIRN